MQDGLGQLAISFVIGVSYLLESFAPRNETLKTFLSDQQSESCRSGASKVPLLCERGESDTASGHDDRNVPNLDMGRVHSYA